MVPMALELGILLPHADGVLKRVKAFNKIKKLPLDHIYIGQGSSAHSVMPTKWSSPFSPGVHGSASECVALYLDHIWKQGLMDQIEELRGMTLVCDCEPDEPCRGDALTAAFYPTGWLEGL